MAIFTTRKRHVLKARSRVRATPARVEALQRQMESSVSFSFTEGCKALRAKVDQSALVNAFKKGDYKPLIAEIPIDKEDITEAFNRTAEDLTGVIDKGGKLAAQEVSKVTDSRFEYNADNPRTANYIDKFTGELAQNMRDDMMDNLKSAVQDNLVNGTPIDETATLIRQSLGLNNRQAIALQNFEGSKKDKAAYAERLLDQRAMMIARTEVSYAQNEARLQVWDEAQDQGLIGQNATKIWKVDGKPCKICEPMDGQEVSLDEPFETPLGDELYAPPAHPHCLCVTILGSTD